MTGSFSTTATHDGILRHDEVERSWLGAERWDGRDLPFVPSAGSIVDATLQLHGDFDRELDPIDYQVLRYRFWSIQLEQADTIKRVSGTPIVCYMNDFNVSLLTENGDMFMAGPFVQLQVGMADLDVKWTLQYRSANPGIQDGDVFFQNDPYVGACHQQDMSLFAPVFTEGRLFCWIYTTAHQWDVGGNVPGSFNRSARDIYQEPTRWRPMKVVERDKVRDDLFESIVQQSRTPDLVLLQLRSQLAGLRAAKARLSAMIGEYGPRKVKGVMRAMIRDTSQTVSRRLLQVPDGVWEESYYLGCLAPGDRRAHRLRMTVRKQGDRLTFSNDGTDPQFGSANGTYGTFRTAVIAAMTPLFAWDQLYCPAGVLNQLSFRPVPGTLLVARLPGAVTFNSADLSNCYLAGNVLGKMVLPGPPELRTRANAAGGLAICAAVTCHGTDAQGKLRFGMSGDTMTGALGAFPDRDGVDLGGMWWVPFTNAGNVEEWEHAGPVLYLWRREQRDSGGPGRFRGGNALSTGVVGHNVRQWYANLLTSDPAVNASPGLAGGYPGHSGNQLALAGTRIRAILAAGRLPASREALEAEIGPVPRLSFHCEDFDVGPDGVVVAEYCSGGGYGDPTTRDPDRVLADVRAGAVSTAAAARDYGVVIRDDQVDIEATAVRRSSLRSARLAASRAPAIPLAGRFAGSPDHRRAVTGGLELVEADGISRWLCAECGRYLAPSDRSYRDGAALLQSSPQDVDPVRYPDPGEFSDRAVVLRQWLCPECGLQIAMDCCMENDPPPDDFRLDIASFRTIGT
ncbi:MAG: hydantoinase B/oxoprolinase family protein [Gammaproteobacteria bacterium]